MNMLLAMDAEAVLNSILLRFRLASTKLTRTNVEAVLKEYPLTAAEIKRFWRLFGREVKAPREVAWFMKLYEQRDTKRGWQARGKRVRAGQSAHRLTFFTRRDAGRIRAALAAGGQVQVLARIFRTVQQFQPSHIYFRKQVKQWS